MCRFLISPNSPNRSCTSSSLASSCTLVTSTIQPSIERTATAPALVRGSLVEVEVVEDLGGSMSMDSVAADMLGRVGGGKREMGRVLSCLM